MKRIIAHAIAITLLFLNTKIAYALSEFKTDISSVYVFDDRGNASITHDINLTNTLSHIYPTTYNLAVSSGDITKVKAKVNNSLVDPDIDQQPSITSIHLPIHNPSIGQDKVTAISLAYQADSFAEKTSNTVIITIPKTIKGNETQTYKRTVIVPDTYPSLTFSNIPVKNQTDTQGSTQYLFEGGGDQNLTLHFGDLGSYDLKLSYVLKNNTPTSALSELALPMDTSYQQVYLNKLEPPPLEIVVDPDGNWLARYNLEAGTSLPVAAELTVVVSPTPRFFDPSSSTPLGENKYWEQTSEIKRLASNLKNPKNLYTYLLETLTYDYSQASLKRRLGAQQALAEPNSAICTEYTDVFVATSRAMGIPSRAIIGYALTSHNTLRPQGNQLDILHAYPEYQDPSTKVWQSIDPTWGYTTGGSEYFTRMDFGHIAFVRWGNSSSYPLPAGSYREPSSSKQIDVVSRQEMPQAPDIKYEIITKNSQQFLVNTGRSSIVKKAIKVNDNELQISYLPPYGQLQVYPTDNSSKPLYRNIIYILTLAISVTLFIVGLRIIWKKRYLR